MRKRRSFAALRMTVAALLVAFVAHSQTGPSDLERIRGEITRLRRKLEDVRAQTKTAERELEEVGIELDIRTRELQIAVDLQQQIEHEQQSVAVQVAEVGQRIVRQKEFLRRRLAELYRLGGLSYLRLLMSMDERRNPIEAGLGWCCKEATGFIGSEAVGAARESGTEQNLAPFVLTGAGIPRQGNAVVSDDREVGVVTSGTLSPCMEVGIGMGYVPVELAEPGTELQIDVRGKRRPARIESKPLYRKESD